MVVEMEAELDFCYYCPIHGEHPNQVCIPCYDVQAVRVERESAELRYANTTSALRAKVVAMSNGHPK